jgi:hypothetical protein
LETAVAVFSSIEDHPGTKKIAATNDAPAAKLFHWPMRCSSPTMVSMLFGTWIRAERSQHTAAINDAMAMIA